MLLTPKPIAVDTWNMEQLYATKREKFTYTNNTRILDQYKRGV